MCLKIGIKGKNRVSNIGLKGIVVSSPVCRPKWYTEHKIYKILNTKCAMQVKESVRLYVSQRKTTRRERLPGER